MKIVSEDGKEFESVNACKEYESNLDRMKVYTAEKDNIVRYIVNFLGDSEEERELIVIHAKDKWGILAGLVARCVFDDDYVLGEDGNPIRRYAITKVSNVADGKLAAKLESSGRFIVHETADVPQLYKDNGVSLKDLCLDVDDVVDKRAACSEKACNKSGGCHCDSCHHEEKHDIEDKLASEIAEFLDSLREQTEKSCAEPVKKHEPKKEVDVSDIDPLDLLLMLL